MPNYEAYTGFNPDKTAKFFETRGWPVNTIQRQELRLVRVTPGAPVECGDGRFDQLEDRKTHGVRILGGINVVMAMLTGGDEVGLQRAAELLIKNGATPGTHSAEVGGCGYADLWMANRLESARYPYQLHGVLNKEGRRWGECLEDIMGDFGGRHYRLNGNHKEEGVRLNPFKGYTEVAKDGSRFRMDDWFMVGLGITDWLRWFKIAEVVEKLKPEAAKLEIIIP